MAPERVTGDTSGIDAPRGHFIPPAIRDVKLACVWLDEGRVLRFGERQDVRGFMLYVW
jgi:hypothetical protein